MDRELELYKLKKFRRYYKIIRIFNIYFFIMLAFISSIAWIYKEYATIVAVFIIIFYFKWFEESVSEYIRTIEERLKSESSP